MKSWMVGLLLIAVISAKVPTSQPTLAGLKDAVQRKGAERVVKDLNRQGEPSPWNVIEERTATGNGGWLRLVKQLREYTDAGNSEGLDNAVAEALPRNPLGVLLVLSGDPAKGFTVQKACSTETFIEVPASKLRRHVSASIAAVEKVSDPRVQAVRSECLSQLRHSLK